MMALQTPHRTMGHFWSYPCLNLGLQVIKDNFGGDFGAWQESLAVCLAAEHCWVSMKSILGLPEPGLRTHSHCSSSRWRHWFRDGHVTHTAWIIALRRSLTTTILNSSLDTLAFLSSKSHPRTRVAQKKAKPWGQWAEQRTPLNVWVQKPLDTPKLTSLFLPSFLLYFYIFFFSFGFWNSLTL